MTETRMIDAALRYARAGWAVHPLRRRSKLPASEHGVSDATTDVDTLRRWWEMWPEANIGIAAGASRLLIVDVDPDRGGEDTLHALETAHGPFPETLRALTPSGGQHIYLQEPKGMTIGPGVDALGPGIDIRAGGSYVVAPPSRDERGEWAWETGPGEAKLARCPEWLVERLSKRPGGLHDASEGIDTAAVLRGVPRGERDEKLFRLACKLRGADVPRDVAEGIVTDAAAKCTPPFPREQALRKVRSAYEYPAGGIETFPANGRTPAEGAVIEWVGDVEREEVEWLWKHRIPRGKLTLLSGDPGMGKTFLHLAIAKAITRGEALPGDDTKLTPGKALIMTAEDGTADTIRPRFEDMGGDVSRLAVLNAVRDAAGKERWPHLRQDLAVIEQLIVEHGFELLVIDPLNAYLEGTDGNVDIDIRSVLGPIAAMADRTGVAVICLRHLTKGERSSVIYRGQGNIAYTAAARSELLVGRNPENEDERVVICIKHNLAPDTAGWTFTIDTWHGFRWGEETALTAEQIVGQPADQEERSQLDEAKDFLRHELGQGPLLMKALAERAKSAGIKWRTVERAKSALGIIAKPNGFGGAWRWTLPETANGGDWQSHQSPPTDVGLADSTEDHQRPPRDRQMADSTESDDFSRDRQVADSTESAQRPPKRPPSLADSGLRHEFPRDRQGISPETANWSQSPTRARARTEPWLDSPETAKGGDRLADSGRCPNCGRTYRPGMDYCMTCSACQKAGCTAPADRDGFCFDHVGLSAEEG